MSNSLIFLPESRTALMENKSPKSGFQLPDVSVFVTNKKSKRLDVFIFTLLRVFVFQIQRRMHIAK